MANSIEIVLVRRAETMKAPDNRILEQLDVPPSNGSIAASFKTADHFREPEFDAFYASSLAHGMPGWQSVGSWTACGISELYKNDPGWQFVRLDIAWHPGN